MTAELFPSSDAAYDVGGESRHSQHEPGNRLAIQLAVARAIVATNRADVARKPHPAVILGGNRVTESCRERVAALLSQNLPWTLI